MSEEAKTYPTTIDLVDRLRAENLNAKMQNVQLQLQLMQSELQKALSSRNELATQAQTLRDEFREKYGVALERLKINDDGTYAEVQGT